MYYAQTNTRETLTSQSQQSHMVQLANGNFRVKYKNFSQHGKIVHLALSAGNKMTPVKSGGNRITKSCFKKFKVS